ncbi:MAG TPA: DHHA1 domain-containing protein [Candidatus Saccharibacteria bacterium]|nr:DHHA1 domain-containing protein [Candidatus Saccharibacteria bacterium]
MNIFDEILRARGLEGRARDAFLNPSYDARHDPFLLPDMDKAVERLVMAHERQENVTIYGDYDIDGLTASTVLIDAFESFGFENVDIFIPNRFVEGYGLTVEAVEKIAATGAQLIVTVDCGSLSEKEIIRANELGVDVIVTDHHNVAPVQPPAVAVINPKRLLQEYPEVYENFILQDLSADFLDAVGSSQDNSVSAPLSSAELAGAQTSSTSKGAETELSGFTKTPKKSADKSSASLYPFLDLAGVGVAFKLVQALQTRLDGLPEGQEKWLLDLVALGTVCDVVTLVDENRAIVYWGLKVMAKTRRPGLRALMAVAGVDPDKITTRSLGFALGPRMNAAGRLETAQYALDMLLAKDRETALEKAQLLDEMNQNRRSEQDKILKEAIIQAERYVDDSVLVVSAPGWNHGIIGIVAAKLLEKYKKPTYVLEEMGSESKGSARSYGDFSAADAIRAADDIITKGGGHKLAAGVTLPTKNIQAFRERVNAFYRDQELSNQQALLLPKADTTADFSDITEELIEKIATLEPFGSGNPQPILTSQRVTVVHRRRMGTDAQHVKLELQNTRGQSMSMLAFSAPEHFFVQVGQIVTVWYQPDVNEWNGRRTIEGRLLHIEIL